MADTRGIADEPDRDAGPTGIGGAGGAGGRPSGRVLPSNVASFDRAEPAGPRPASLWRRGFAFLVFDQLQLALMMLVLALLLGRAAELGPLLRAGWEPIQIAAAWFYWTSRESSEARATYGKHFVGLVVTDLAGGRLSPRRALVRNFVKQGVGLVPVLGLPALGVDRQAALLVAGAFVWAECSVALFTRRRRALHDLLAGSVVVRRERPDATGP